MPAYGRVDLISVLCCLPACRPNTTWSRYEGGSRDVATGELHASTGATRAAW